MPKAKEQRDMIKVRFINNESPGVDVQFTYKPPGTPANQVGEHYHLYPSRTYDLPVDVVDHLNSLGYPVYTMEMDEESKQMVSKPTGFFNRFTCHPTERYGAPREAAA